MRFTVGGDAGHYTVGANAAFLLLLVHVLPSTTLLGSTLAFFCHFLHMFRQLLPATEGLLQFAEILRFTAFNRAVEVSPFDAIPLAANSLSIRLWAYISFLQLALALHYVPILVRLSLPLPVNTAVILQQ